LAAAAHLKAANVEVAFYGRAMEFWKNQMPAGMVLRSPWDASHISDPTRFFTLDSYHEKRGIEKSARVSRERFIEYGMWFQRLAAPGLDNRYIRRIDKEGTRFRLLLEDGASFYANRVIVATGIAPFAHRPVAFDHLPPDLVSHAYDHHDFTRFAGKRVAVVGGGQSGLECAALLSENGAEVELIIRAASVRWLHAREILRHPWNPFRTLLFHPTDVGPPLLTQVSARPDWFRLLPNALQGGFAYRCIRPAGAAWLRPRMGKVRITMKRSIDSATDTGGRLCLSLNDGTMRSFNHVVLATGYRVDILRYPFLPAKLTGQIQCTGGYPELNEGFECSIPGLHFLGAPAATSFGPLMRFVSGTAYSAAAVTRCVTGEAKRGPSWRTGCRLPHPQEW
jgi:hypothetical protein